MYLVYLMYLWSLIKVPFELCSADLFSQFTDFSFQGTKPALKGLILCFQFCGTIWSPPYARFPRRLLDVVHDCFKHG